MGFGQAFDEATVIITLIMLIPAFLILFVMTQNIGNPEFVMLAAFTAGMESIVQAMVPAFGLTIFFAVHCVLDSSRINRALIL